MTSRQRPGTPSTPSITRRKLLTASAAAASVAAAGVAGATSPAPAVHRRRRRSDSLRIGLIGIGRRGHAHLHTLGYNTTECEMCRSATNAPEPIAGTEVVAVADTYEEYRLRAQAHLKPESGTAAYSDYRKMLDQEDLDVVVIATPDHTHAPIAMDAARAGCDSYIEKCMTNSVAETLELGRVLESTGRLVQVGTQLRQDAMRRTAQRIVEQGHLGKVVLVQDFLHKGGFELAWNSPLAATGDELASKVDWPVFLGSAPWREYDPSRYFEWRKYWDYGTGLSGDWLSHSLDSTDIILGAGTPHSATASGGVYVWKDGRETPDTFVAAFDYPDADLTMTCQATLGNSYTGHMTRIFGTDASMELSWEIKVYPDANSDRHRSAIQSGSRHPRKPYIHIERDAKSGVGVTAGPTELWLEGRGMTMTTRNGAVRDTTRLHHEEFVECIRSRKQPSAGFQAAFHSTIGCSMAAEAYLQRRRVEWDPERNLIV